MKNENVECRNYGYQNYTHPQNYTSSQVSQSLITEIRCGSGCLIYNYSKDTTVLYSTQANIDLELLEACVSKSGFLIINDTTFFSTPDIQQLAIRYKCI